MSASMSGRIAWCIAGWAAWGGLALSAANADPFLVATFGDPATGASTPMFTVMDTSYNSGSGTITGGWPDSLPGLNLDVAVLSASFANAYFTITDTTGGSVNYTGSYRAGTVNEPGVIKFYQDNTATLLLQIDFATAQLTTGGLDGDNIFSMNDVIFSGPGINSASWDEESFGFAFANRVRKKDALNRDIGFTATAAFTSSAIPEPASLAAWLVGLPLLIRRRKP